MRDLRNHPARFLRVGTFGDAMHLAEAEGFERLAHLARAADAAADLLHFDHLPVRAHAAFPSGSSRPRSAPYACSLRTCSRALNVALTTLCGLAVPSDLVRMFWIPADSRIARTGPPAMRPGPSEAGLRRTLPAPYWPTVAWGMVVPFMAIFTMFFLAISMPFLMAAGTSLAFPEPKPPRPAPSPSQARALELKFLP